MTRSPAGAESFTGSLSACALGAIETLGRPPNVTA